MITFDVPYPLLIDIYTSMVEPLPEGFEIITKSWPRLHPADKPLQVAMSRWQTRAVWFQAKAHAANERLCAHRRAAWKHLADALLEAAWPPIEPSTREDRAYA